MITVSVDEWGRAFKSTEADLTDIYETIADIFDEHEGIQEVSIKFRVPGGLTFAATATPTEEKFIKTPEEITATFNLENAVKEFFPAITSEFSSKNITANELLRTLNLENVVKEPSPETTSEVSNEHITVGDLTKALETYNKDIPIILSSDSEGNQYSPLSSWGVYHYIADGGWSGFILDDEELQDDEYSEYENPVRALCFWPVR